MNQNALKSGEKPTRDEKGRFLEGHNQPGPGRPGGSVSITTKIKQILKEIPEGEKITRLDALTKRIFLMAMQDKNEQMIKLIWNYVDGMPKEKIEMEGEIEHKDNKILDLLKDANKETRKKVIDGFIEILRERRSRGGVSK
jgi:hypothetical protein